MRNWVIKEGADEAFSGPLQTSRDWLAAKSIQGAWEPANAELWRLSPVRGCVCEGCIRGVSTQIRIFTKREQKLPAIDGSDLVGPFPPQKLQHPPANNQRLQSVDWGLGFAL